MEAPSADEIRFDCRNRDVGVRAGESMDRHGLAIFDGLMDAEKVEALNRELLSFYPQYLEDAESPGTMWVGPRRYQVSIALRGGFADPDVYGHPAILAAVRQILGEDAILAAFGGVMSLGHSEPQGVHRDGPFLFPDVAAKDLPCHALTFSLPLVALDDRVGTTALWPGSHRRVLVAAEHEPSLKPQLPLGSALIWDYRILHRGEPNVTATARPLVYAVYARGWFRDHCNFRRPGMRPLILDREFLNGVPEDRRALFAHVGAD